MAAQGGIAGIFRFFGGAVSKLFSSFLRIRLFFLFTLFIVINGLVIGISESPDAGLEYLGNRFFNPLVSLQQKSAQIIQEGGLIFLEGKGFWKELISLWDYVASIWVIYLQLSVLAFLVSVSPFSNRSEAFKNWMFGILMFFLIQMFFLSTQGLSIWGPFIALRDVAYSFPYILDPLANTGDYLYSDKFTQNLSEF